MKTLNQKSPQPLKDKGGKKKKGGGGRSWALLLSAKEEFYQHINEAANSLNMQYKSFL